MLCVVTDTMCCVFLQARALDVFTDSQQSVQQDPESQATEPVSLQQPLSGRPPQVHWTHTEVGQQGDLQL